jgi:3-keto-disaccharide hydrolase
MRLLWTFITAAACLPAADWKTLFNGRDLTGWEMVGPGRFLVENGMLKTEGGMGLLWYKGQQIGNATLRVVFKTTQKRDNSGVYIRLPEPPGDPWYAVHNGYEVQIADSDDPWHATGSLYSLAKTETGHQNPPGEWNTMDITIDGQKTTVVLNGKPITEFRGNQEVPPRKQWYEPVRGPRPDKGYIGLQNHDGRSTIWFKEVSVRPLR